MDAGPRFGLRSAAGEHAPIGTVNTPARPADVFISYKREERDAVTTIAERLRALALAVWFDVGLRQDRGEDECRAWPIRRGTTALKAAGKIHSDIERGFIRAEVVAYEDFIRLGSEAKCREAGKLRLGARTTSYATATSSTSGSPCSRIEMRGSANGEREASPTERRPPRRRRRRRPPGAVE